MDGRLFMLCQTEEGMRKPHLNTLQQCQNTCTYTVPVKVAVPNKSSISGAFPNLCRYRL